MDTTQNTPAKETPNEELRRLVERGVKHQKALGLSDNAFAARYKTYVGSAKSWRYRLINANLDGVNLDRFLKKMRALVSLLDGGSTLDQVYEDLPIFQQFRGRYETLLATRTDRRCMVMLGETGVGKSVCARWALAADPQGTGYVRCQPTWKDNKLAILNGILAAIGADTYKRTSVAFDHVLAHFKSNPIAIIFDEAHDGGVMLLKLIKSFIDESGAKFVVMAYPTLWKRMLLASSDAHAEARQLFGRTQKPIFDTYASGTTLDNVEVYLARATSINGASRDVAKQILEIVRANGNLRLLSDIVEAADTLYLERDTEVDGSTLISIAQSLAKSANDKR